MLPPNASLAAYAFPSTSSFQPEDIAELERWGAVAAKWRWFVQPDDEGGLIAKTDGSREYVVLAFDSPRSKVRYNVEPTVGRWELSTDGDLVGTFDSLREALEAVCPRASVPT